MRRFLPAVVACLLLLPLPLRADDVKADGARADEAFSSVAPAPPAPADSGASFGSLVYFEHHGYFRFRSDLFWNGDLDSGGSSGMAPPLIESPGNDGLDGGHSGTHVIAGANLRFRYAPMVRVGERFRFFAQIDVLDNIVMGSTPRGGGESLWGRLDDGQAPPASTQNSFSDAIRARALWGELSLFDAITLRVGRMPDHWGLGILRNAGLGLDADFGSTVDRIEAMATYEGFHFGFTYDFFIEGVTSASRAQPLGQPYGLGDVDDVGQWVVFLEQRPRTIEEKEAREKALWTDRRPVFDWGVMSVFRTQDADLTVNDGEIVQDRACLNGSDPKLDLDYDCWTATPRDVFLWYPDVWARVQWSPMAGHLLRIELELAMVYGTLSSSAQPRSSDSSKDILMGGGVLQVEYDFGETEVGLDFGFATGDDTGGVFGVLDQSEVVDQDTPSALSPQLDNDYLTNFKMHRAFQVDHLLYREVIGAVTNSWYLKPWVRHRFWQHGDTAFGARFDLEYARAFVAEGTPGDAYDLGIETDLTGYLTIGDAFEARLVFAALFPLDGLGGARDAEPALTLQGNLFWKF